MTQEPRSDKKPSKPNSREQRLKAALKANMGRRKAQARARAADETDETSGHETGTDNEME